MRAKSFSLNQQKMVNETNQVYKYLNICHKTFYIIQVWNFDNRWSFELFDCCSANIKDCSLAFCCFPCFACSLFRRVGENCCTPFILPASLMTLRTKVRASFRIRGTYLTRVYLHKNVINHHLIPII